MSLEDRCEEREHLLSEMDAGMRPERVYGFFFLFFFTVQKKKYSLFFLGRGNYRLSAGSAAQTSTHNSSLLVWIVAMMIHTRLD